MRVLFVQQDHVSPTGPVGEAFAGAGYEVAKFGGGAGTGHLLRRPGPRRRPGRPGHQGRTARGGVDPDRDEPARPDRAGAMVPVAFRPLGPAGRHPRAGQDRDRRAGLHRGAQPGRPVHPELTPQMLDGWLSNGGRQQARALGLDPDQLTAETAARSGEGRLRAKRLVRIGSACEQGQDATRADRRSRHRFRRRSVQRGRPGTAGDGQPSRYRGAQDLVRH